MDVVTKRLRQAQSDNFRKVSLEERFVRSKKQTVGISSPDGSGIPRVCESSERI